MRLKEDTDIVQLSENMLVWSGEKKNTELNRSGEVVYLTFKRLSDCGFIRHGFSTRIGGVSQGFFSSMNLSFSRGDDERAVHENFKRIAAAIGVSCEDMVFSDQTHTTNVRVVTKEDRGNGMTRQKSFFETDGMVTNVPGLVLTTFYADCVPLYFVDPVHRAIGLSHSGWRGTVGRIGKKTLDLMQQMYGTRPEDVIAAIGPSICRDCYEVSEDVAEQFKSTFHDYECAQILFPHTDSGEKEQKYQLDLWKANELILSEAGITAQNLIIPELCTCHNPDFLFSHRATNGKRGNLAAFLSIQQA
ncbi:MAG: peptidoglycan editing factor PgeF [bacterium]|nr:peptidoglycan editing factor PgeF [bacterium]